MGLKSIFEVIRVGKLGLENMLEVAGGMGLESMLLSQLVYILLHDDLEQKCLLFFVSPDIY